MEHNASQQEIHLPFRYKFVILDKTTRKLLAWENGRQSSDEHNTRAQEFGARCGRNAFHQFPSAWRGAGVAIPVFSVRSDDDFGVGDFFDLKKMVDWAVVTGQKFLQILPINDTTMTHTWTDSYPYNANSTFALHPMFMRLSEL